MNIWFTADLHLNHENILGFHMKTRKFHTVKDMNFQIIENWNKVVKHDDIIYIIGDFILGEAVEDLLNEFVCSLNGWIHLIPGNHDTTRKLLIYDINNLLTIEQPLTILKKPHAVLCHYPLAVWPHNSKGSWMLHGHSHGSYQAEGKIMDVGIDTHPEFRPYHLDEITEIMNQKQFKQVDYHA